MAVYRAPFPYEGTYEIESYCDEWMVTITDKDGDEEVTFHPTHDEACDYVARAYGF